MSNIPETTLTLDFERFSGNSPELLTTPLQADLGRLATIPVVLLGIPGAGKTTLANELRTLDPSINYISLGDISRGLDPDSSERKELDRLFALGKPVGLPELFLDIVEPHVDEALRRTGGFLLDGIPKKQEEVTPLLDFLASKGADPALVISCETPPLLAYSRVLDRSEREGDADTTDIFLNRTKVYLRDLDLFKTALTGDGEVPLVIIDTNKHLPKPAAQTVIALADTKPRDRIQENETIHEAAELFDCFKADNRTDALRIIGSRFDDTLKAVDYGLLNDPGTNRETKQAYVEAAMLLDDPRLQETPKFLSRLARNYIDTTAMSVVHIYDSLLEEVVLRHGEDFSEKDMQEVYAQQIGLKEGIQYLQGKILSGHTLDSLADQEVASNLPELKHVEAVLKDRAPIYGISSEDISIIELMKQQPQLWGQLTSNQVIFAPDLNYRRTANGLPGSHHSLLPFTGNKRALSANSMGEYVPFIEAVSATENTYSSTFGFVHFVGMDDKGEAFGVEYPIMMHDRRLLALKSNTVNDVLKMMDDFYFNHDLWHNLIPVYSPSFILHHPDAPLTYGGKTAAYSEFGIGLRSEKEEYEIGVAMAHTRTQNERFALDPAVRLEQETLLLDALDKLSSLTDELTPQCDPAEIANIIDYLATGIASKAYNVFPDRDPIYETIRDKLTDLGVPTIELRANEVADLLYMQGLLDPARVDQIFAEMESVSADDKRNEIAANSNLAMALIRECLDSNNEGRETGAEFIAKALQSWGVIVALSERSSIELDVIQKSRWLAMVAPQRQQLRGHMEKVHGKPGYKFNDNVLEDPRDLVLLQHTAIATDKEEYEYRSNVRRENQRLSYEIYSLMFDDGQAMHQDVRQAFDAYRLSPDIGQRLFSKEAAGMLDAVMQELVASTYGDLTEELDYLASYADSLTTSAKLPMGKELAQSIRSTVHKYRLLSQKEREHQLIRGVSYAATSQQIVDETMTIV